LKREMEVRYDDLGVCCKCREQCVRDVSRFKGTQSQSSKTLYRCNGVYQICEGLGRTMLLSAAERSLMPECAEEYSCQNNFTMAEINQPLDFFGHR